MARKLDSVTLSADRVARWADFTADANPLHLDAAFAATTSFGVPIAHGHLVACLALDAAQQVATTRFAEGAAVAVRFLAPVAVGATVDLLWDDAAGMLTVAQQGAEGPLVELEIRSADPPHCLVTRALVDAYAAAARDRNPIHMSDEAARQWGFDGAIAHGMLTLGWASVQLLDDMDPRALHALRARFTAPVPVGEEIRLEIDTVDTHRAVMRVKRSDGIVALTAEATHGHAPSAPLTGLPADAEVVADRVLRVDPTDAIRFARAVGVDGGIFTSDEAARAAGFPSIPIVPTLAFAATALGYLPTDPANAGTPAPDAVTDCQAWARTDRPVVHAGQELAFARPLLAGERMRARTAVIARSARTNAQGRRLRYTAVRTVFIVHEHEVIATSDMNLVVTDD